MRWPSLSRMVVDTRGNIAVMGICLLLAAGLITGGVVDFISLAMQRQDIQAAADAAALGAARELQLTGGEDSDDRMDAIAAVIAEQNLEGRYRGIETTVTPVERRALKVVVTAAPRVFFPGPVAQAATIVSAEAVAEISGAPTCMIGLDTKVKHTLWMQKDAAIQARGCAIYSNSLAKDGVLVEDRASVEAGFICSAGGVKVEKAMALDPEPVTDCPAINDPLASRPPPPVGGCDFKKMKIKQKQHATLSPATYCGGLEIEGEVTLKPGVYVIKDGELKISRGGKLYGEHVGFFMTGKGAFLNFDKDSSIRLSAPRDGPMAGLLVYEDRKVKPSDPPPGQLNYNAMGGAKEHRIRSRDAPLLVGTIYISRNRLLISGEDTIASESAYTIIVAREFALGEGPLMVLNTNYEASDVPVPDGVGNFGNKKTRLVR